MMNSLAGLKTVKKKYFTQSQSVLPISHSKEEFVSIIEKKREYQTLIKKELQSLQEIENQEKEQLQRWQDTVQNNKICVKAFTLGFKREEKSQEEFIGCFKQLRVLREKRQFAEVFKALKIVHNEQNIFRKRIQVQQKRSNKAFHKFKRLVQEVISLKNNNIQIGILKNQMREKKIIKTFNQLKQIVKKKNQSVFERKVRTMRKKAALKQSLQFIDKIHQKRQIDQKIYQIQQLRRHHCFSKFYKLINQQQQSPFSQNNRQLNNLIRERMLKKAQYRLLQNYKPNLLLPFQMVKSSIRLNAFKDLKKGIHFQMKEILLQRMKSLKSRLFVGRLFKRIKQAYSIQKHLYSSKESLSLALKRSYFLRMIKYGSSNKSSQINQNIERIKHRKIKHSLSLISRIINTSIIKKQDEQIQVSQNSENSLQMLADQLQQIQQQKQQNSPQQSTQQLRKYLRRLYLHQLIKFFRREQEQIISKRNKIQFLRKKSYILKFFGNYSQQNQQQLSEKIRIIQTNIKRLAFTQFFTRKQVSQQNLPVQAAILRSYLTQKRMRSLMFKLEQTKNESLYPKTNQVDNFLMQKRINQFIRNLKQNKKQRKVKNNKKNFNNIRRQQNIIYFFTKLTIKNNNYKIESSQSLGNVLMSTYFQQFKQSILRSISIKDNLNQIIKFRQRKYLKHMKDNIIQRIVKKQVKSNGIKLKLWLTNKFSNIFLKSLNKQLLSKNMRDNYIIILNLRRRKQLQNLFKGIIQKRDDQQYHKTYNIPISPKHKNQTPSMNDNNSFANYLNNSNNHHTQQFQNYLPIQHQISPSNYFQSANQDDYSSQQSPQNHLGKDFQENIDMIQIQPSPLYEKLSYQLYQSNYDQEQENNRSNNMEQSKTKNEQSFGQQSQQEQQEHLLVEKIIQKMQDDSSPLKSSIKSSTSSQLSPQSKLQILHKCFNSLKMFTNQKKILKKFLEIEQSSQNQSVSYYPTSLHQKKAFQSFLY